jgi:type II restriction/modification system DNA methylase subunit YeeA
MPPIISPQDFVTKWRNTTLKERSASQEHFIDLCHLLGHPTPAEADPTGSNFTFEAGATKAKGGQGWADVWKRNYFAWEYKGKHADLEKAYQQLLQYREALENPPLLIVSDIDKIVIHTNFTNSIKRVYPLTLDDLLVPSQLAILRAAFYNPDELRAVQTAAQVTEQAASQFARLATILQKYGEEPQKVAHFLIRLLFCLFAEDIGLLPNRVFTHLVERSRTRPKAFSAQLQQLFSAMSTGGWFGSEEIVYFDGRLFDDAQMIELDSEGLDILAKVSGLDWSSIEPSVFGTLFERSLDPSKRAQLGAHYTSKEDILLIIEPVLMAPLRRRWTEVQAQAATLADKREAAKAGQRTKLQNELANLFTGFAGEIAGMQVLDPACGSGNFLYVALRQLLDLEKEVITSAGDLNVGRFFPSVNPAQLHGIEINEYAHELAQTTIWIGYIQWLNENGFSFPGEPILRLLDNIQQTDAILAFDYKGLPVEPEWPNVDVIIGNPPFLGGNKIRHELGSQYVDRLFTLYNGRVPAFADLVCYWFEKARDMIAKNRARRVGLLATQGIRGGVNRKVLEKIKETGDIFWAQSDRDWILDGANLHISMVGFDKGTEYTKVLDGIHVSQIYSDLSKTIDLTVAVPLKENQGLGFRGNQKGGPFDITEGQAEELLNGHNPNSRPNSEVIRPWVNGIDITQRNRNMWLIDFGIEMSLEKAALYEKPFEYVKENVYPVRKDNNRKAYRDRWWIHAEARPSMREAISSLNRYIVTPHVSKHRLFVWLNNRVIPDHQLIVIARSDDYFFGVLHSKAHEVWALHLGTALEDRPRYTPTTTFETFPFPWPPGSEPQNDPRLIAISDAARELVESRDKWLNPKDINEQELRKRTLTNLYNQNPTWLQNAHRKLDRAVFAAYGWPDTLTDEEILERLLKLNLKRADKEKR